MGSKNEEAQPRRDVSITFANGRREQFTGLREEIADDIEDLPFRAGSGVEASSSVQSRSGRRD